MASDINKQLGQQHCSCNKIDQRSVTGMFSLLILLCHLLWCISGEKCLTPNKEEGSCVSLYACQHLLTALSTQNPVTIQFVQHSSCGGNALNPLVCCGPSSNFIQAKGEKNDTQTIKDKDDSRKLLPGKSYCGYQHSDDYFGDENGSVRITEFPWLAGILYKGYLEKRQPRCGGSLINDRYVLTSAHCIDGKNSEPVLVSLGEYDTREDTDCVQEAQFEEECSDPLQIYGIERIILHSNYNHIYAHDIGLIRLNSTVRYNDYVRPICLPFPDTKLANPGDTLQASGWGIKRDRLLTPVKKKILATLLTNEACTKQMDNDQFKIFEGHMCALFQNTSRDIPGRGDGGGPLMYSPGKLQWHLEGVSSFGRTYGEYPDVYTRVNNYLDWILENLEK